MTERRRAQDRPTTSVATPSRTPLKSPRSDIGGQLVAACSTKESERALVIVSNEVSGDVSIVDSSRDDVVRTVAVAKRPRGMRISPDGKLLFVALSGSQKSSPPSANAAKGDDDDERPRDGAADGIGVVDLEGGVLVRTIAAGRDPESFDITPDGRQLYVANEETSAVSVVDMRTGRVVRTISVGTEPEGVTVSPDGKLVYVTSESENAVDVISTSDQRVVARVPTSARPRAVALSADGSQAYVTAELGGKLHMIDTRSRAPNGDVRTGGPEVKPMGIAVAPDGVLAYVANGRGGSVAVIDLPSRSVVHTIEHVGARPWGLAPTPDGKKLYAAAGPDLAALDPARGTVVKRIPVGKGPWGVVVARRSP